jgi:hypothetical protein
MPKFEQQETCKDYYTRQIIDNAKMLIDLDNYPYAPEGASNDTKIDIIFLDLRQALADYYNCIAGEKNDRLCNGK